MWSGVVVAVLSSRMSAGGSSLTGRYDNVSCLDIKFVYLFKQTYLLIINKVK